ncbi:Protein CBR-CEH-93 [Caenorhabditis briggsae]|uniref:Protein CBR-CEH-93 n=1 Tax=Caenorhabditis briggsae TaxID=6238 RepID=A8XF58_CAEBR|nr:Protein CBR-CEH-93 [Caenorhabditis briggsae]CAP31280.2 Protein CBR-CEH-93 [Caenorhabditis briggsae]
MAFNQPSSSNSAADTTFIVFDEDYVSELRARLIDSVSRFGTINPLSMMSLLEAERQIAESKNQSSEAGSHDSGSGSLTAQPVQAPDQDYFYDKYLTASVRKQMAKRLNMTDQELETFLQNRRSEEKRLLDQFKDENSSNGESSEKELRQQLGALREKFTNTLAKVNRYGTSGPLSSVILSSAEALRQKMDGLEHRVTNLLSKEGLNPSGTSEPLSSFKARKLSERQSEFSKLPEGFSRQQVQAMEQKFAVKQFLARYERKQLTESIGLKEREVKEWFQDRREDEEDKEDWEWDTDTDYDYGMDESMEWYPKKFSRQQVQAMEQKFAVKQFLTLFERKELAELIGLKEREVKHWFQNRRNDEEVKEDRESDYSDSDSDYDYDMDGPMEQYSKKFSFRQVEALEQHYAKNKYPDSEVRERLARANNLTETQVETYFIDRRRFQNAESLNQIVRNQQSQGVFRDRTRDKIATVPTWHLSPTKSERFGISKPSSSSILPSGKDLRQKLDDLEHKFTDSFAKDYSNTSGTSEPLSSFKARKLPERHSGFSKFPWESYSRQQFEAMEQKFAVKQFLTHDERKELAESIGLKERQVKHWFQDRRDAEEDKEDDSDLEELMKMSGKVEEEKPEWLKMAEKISKFSELMFPKI